jgi:hypothetical protein
MSKVRVVIFGYGVIHDAKSLALTDGSTSVSGRLSRRVLLGIKFHAFQELNMQNAEFDYFSPKYKFRIAIRKILALGYLTRSFHKGLFNGFKIEFVLDSSLFQEAPTLQFSGGAPYVTRSVGRTGIQIPEYRPYLEYSFRRRQVNSTVYVVNGYAIPLNQSLKNFTGELKNICSAKSIDGALDFLKELPRWHGLHTFFSLFFGSSKLFSTNNVFSPINVRGITNDRWCSVEFVPSQLDISVKPRDITLDPIFFNCQINEASLLHGSILTSDEFLIHYDTSADRAVIASAMWPAMMWRGEESDLIAIPPIGNLSKKVESFVFLASNSNWAHFIEDIAPSAALLLDNSIDAEWVSDVSDPVQLDFLNRIGVSDIAHLGLGSRIMGSVALFAVHLNHRNALINGGGKSKNFSVDTELTNRNRTLLAKGIVSRPEFKKKYFFPREKNLFRRLINQNRVEKFLKSYGYESLQVGSLTLTERLNLLSNCSHIVYEYGAAGINAYFAPDGIRVVELRHPNNLSSEEHHGFIKTTHADWMIVNGKAASTFNRWIFGSDSWKVRLSELKKIIS